jgi:hypothetical protein
MGKWNDGKKAKKTRKPYEKPTATRLTPEQAKLKLLRHASTGDEGARDLLEMMSPEVPTQNSKAKKKSA